MFVQNYFNQKEPKKLVIYIAESDHGDMSYNALTEQIIKYCHQKDLKTVAFSEFPSQALKMDINPTAMDPEAMTLDNNRESVLATAAFLDQECKRMGDMYKRGEIYEATWNSLSKTLTPSELLEQLRDQVDNPAILTLIENDVKNRKQTGTDTIDNLSEFYDSWAGHLNHKEIHEKMVEDIGIGMKETKPDIVIILVGAAHIHGLDAQLSQLSQFKDCQKYLITNTPPELKEGNDPIYDVMLNNMKQIGTFSNFKTNPISIPHVVKEAINKQVTIEKSPSV